MRTKSLPTRTEPLNDAMDGSYWKKQLVVPIQDNDLFRFALHSPWQEPPKRRPMGTVLPDQDRFLSVCAVFASQASRDHKTILFLNHVFSRWASLWPMKGPAQDQWERRHNLTKLKIKEELEWGYWATRRVRPPCQWEELFGLDDKEFRRRIRVLETELRQSQGGKIRVLKYRQHITQLPSVDLTRESVEADGNAVPIAGGSGTTVHTVEDEATEVIDTDAVAALLTEAPDWSSIP